MKKTSYIIALSASLLCDCSVKESTITQDEVTNPPMTQCTFAFNGNGHGKITEIKSISKMDELLPIEDVIIEDDEPQLNAIEEISVVKMTPFNENAPKYLAGVAPGKARANYDASTLVFGNDLFSVIFCTSGNVLTALSIEDKFNGVAYRGGQQPFSITLKDGKTISGRDFKMVEPVAITNLTVNEKATRLSEHKTGKCATFKMRHEALKLDAIFRLEQRDDANYMRLLLDLKSTEKTIDIKNLTLFQAQVKDAIPGGSVDGAPVVTDCFFAGLEHPMSLNKVSGDWEKIASISEIIPMNVSTPKQSTVTFKTPEKMGKTNYLRITLDSGIRNVQIEKVQIFDADNAEEVYFLDETRRTLCSGYESINGVLTPSQVLYEVALPQGNKKYKVTLDLISLVAVGEEAKEIPNTLTLSFNSNVKLATITCNNPNAISLQKGSTFSNSSVIGFARKNQVRRFMANYLEQERPYPYRQFLHYNSWYDIGYFSKYNEADVADIINAYCQELGKKHGIMPKSFLLDDGWDELNSLWNFHSGFPQGFKKIGDLSKSYGSNIGVWLSPFGGYGEPREKRIAAAKEHGYEVNSSGFALSGPKYYARFLEICKEMMIKYNANMFKFDGLSRNGEVPAGSAFNSDFEAAIALIKELRLVRNDVLINLTTGTWASPFWLMTVDCIYRGGWDHEFIGEGSDRQQWLNFRDQETYENIVQRCPSFPINSLMLHGVIFAKHARWLNYDPETDLKSEVRSFFGSGTMLQELYMTPAMMTPYHWNLIAESAKWAEKNADVMVDMHWVGGEPQRNEVYGFGAWIPNKGVITLRNPSSQPQTYRLKLRDALEIPEEIPMVYRLNSPFMDQRIQSIIVDGEDSVEIPMLPFEVLVFDVIDPSFAQETTCK